MNKSNVKDDKFMGGDFASRITAPMRRGKFLTYMGASSAAAALLVTGCSDDDNSPMTPPAAGVDLGSGDIGILNYAYLLEQLEAAFYVQVIMTPYSGITAAETAILTDIRNHELAHRDFFKAALGTAAIASVEVNFSTIDFTSRASVLGTAKVFEDLGVSAYNGAGKLITNVDYLLLAGKIVSVEARHASAIRDLLNPYSADFSGDDVVAGDTGLDVSNTPTAVLTAASPFVKTKVTFDKLPS
ncbi:MAG: ferritin-like domain-containing protein [Chryseolinea sp.]